MMPAKVIAIGMRPYNLLQSQIRLILFYFILFYFILFFRNNMATCIMMIGLPCSGKSTWVESFLKSIPDDEIESWTTVSADYFRWDKGVYKYSNSTEAQIWLKVYDRIRRAANLNRNIIIDNTNISRKRREEQLKNIFHKTHYKIKAVWIVTPFEVCQQRNQERKDKVIPLSAMERMRDGFERPSHDEGFSVIDRVESYA